MPLPIVTLTFLVLAMAQSTPPGPNTSPAVDPATLGLSIGLAIPPFQALDQQGHPRDFSSLAGPNGLVLVFFRSADW
jgi:hypothetical protein